MQYSLKDSVLLEKSDDKTIIINTTQGDFYECSSSAFNVLTLLQQRQASCQVMTEFITSHFEVSQEEAQNDVAHFIQQLSQLGVLNEHR